MTPPDDLSPRETAILQLGAANRGRVAVHMRSPGLWHVVDLPKARQGEKAEIERLEQLGLLEHKPRQTRGDSTRELVARFKLTHEARFLVRRLTR